MRVQVTELEGSASTVVDTTALTVPTLSSAARGYGSRLCGGWHHRHRELRPTTASRPDPGRGIRRGHDRASPRAAPGEATRRRDLARQPRQLHALHAAAAGGLL